ncbi:hypothetical protein TREMEDRAFT_24935 [Tremella mesenterica DSM 1558]|uniref:uncharacterized protein n=1 Tax=Tremella mesenterica (strain ATCC 24925 / CBS 8224 / DSM 1558 / NBRC 9311 / NRRL Y-6157 / RJB 2259-6 / UBC 559-6) TaxID=578456 RepID=UPI0003F496E0|nr:uncharacterized protein TREMEDRAFT_24935 [Tremella mesenterica DSM 1558]EIW73468.1 hypothetical protein TREMEDRAFT_24935 [Tremella mesenterica DSM 1558]
MFGTSLADRLKAAVNQLEATGTSLQNRTSTSNLHPSSPKDGPSSPLVKSPPPTSPSILGISSPLETSKRELSPSKDTSQSATSPTKHAPGNHGYVQAGALAESALSGLRKSLAFGRVSIEGHRTHLGSSNGSTITSPLISQDGQSTSPNPGVSTSAMIPTPGSPAKFLQVSQFSVGSDSPSASNTPRARTPIPPQTDIAVNPLYPPPNPNDPATYPLPPSPDISPSTVELRVPDLKEHTDPIDSTGDDDARDGTEETDRALQLAGTPEEQLAKLTAKYQELSSQHTMATEQIEAANKIIKELTPLEGGIKDIEALEGWIRMMTAKVEMITAEMQRLQAQIKLQDSRMEEIRDTHRLESSSQQELITKLRNQLSTAETNLAQRATELLTLGQLRADISKAQTTAKEEEEKRTKAISLLKTVRAKLVKAEKDKEEVERDRAEERAERSRATEETERVKAEKEREVTALRKGFERELASAKERFEKESQSKKAAWELEMITTKATHAKELSSKSTRINSLETTVKELATTKQQQFELLQTRQAESESALSEKETYQSRTKELEFQLREMTERCNLLEDQLSSSSSSLLPTRGRALLPNGSSSSSVLPGPSGTSAVDVQRLLAEAETKAEAKVNELRARIRALEKERNDVEEEWAAKIGERVREVEKLRRVVMEKENEYADSLRSRQEKDNAILAKEEERRQVEKEVLVLETKIEEARAEVVLAAEAEKLARDEISSLQIQITTLNTQLEDSKNLSNQLRQTNKTLRDELRKVQSSVQLMERQRNPGVGYWGANPSNTMVASGSRSGSGSGMMSPNSEILREGELRRSLESVVTSQPGERNEEEEVNLEYLRNVILQFLEHKEMRPNLIRVMSVILRFTPQELRRLNAKLLT